MFSGRLVTFPSLFSLVKEGFQHFSSATHPCPPIEKPIVTLTDACSCIGKNLALNLKQNPHIGELRLFDDPKDPCEIAQDLAYIDTYTKVKAYAPGLLKEALIGSHVVICVGGQTASDLSSEQLFEKNVDSVRTIAMYLTEFNPSAMYCICKPPVEALVPMVCEEYARSDVLNPRKIVGVTSFAAMAANHFVGQELNRNPTSIVVPIIGGFGPKTTIPVLSQMTPGPSVEYDAKVYSEMQQKIANAEENWLKDYSCDPLASCRGSIVVAASRIVNSVVKALQGSPYSIECAFVKQCDHIGEFLPYMTSIVKFGVEGIVSTHMPKLNDIEILELRAAVPHLLENILMGQTFVNGEMHTYQQKFKNKRKCDRVLKEKLQEFHDRSLGIRKHAKQTC